VPYLTTTLFFLAITLNVFLLVRIRRQDQRATRREKRKKKGAKRYLPFIVLNVTIVITISITIKIEILDNHNHKKDTRPSPSPSVQDDEQDTAKLKEKLRTPYDGNGYNIKPVLETEIVKDRKCCYYELIVKGPAMFPMGEYILQGQSEEYRQPLNNFVDDVIKLLRRDHINHQVFIKGSADKTGDSTFRKTFVIDRYTYRAIPYLPYDPQQQQFIPNQETWKIPGPYANKDLPNLRARYTQDSLKDSSRQLESTILAGVVTPKLNEPKDRNITILLYIQWPK
jgi:hypothetical protein